MTTKATKSKAEKMFVAVFCSFFAISLIKWKIHKNYKNKNIFLLFVFDSLCNASTQRYFVGIFQFATHGNASRKRRKAHAQVF